jgi:hypothetical protein
MSSRGGREPQEMLHVPRPSPRHARVHRPQHREARALGLRPHPRDRLAPHLLVAHPAAARVAPRHLELRLDQHQGLAARGQQPRHRRQDRRQRDERQVAHQPRHLLRQPLEVARVDPVHHHHAGIGLQALVQEPPAHVHRVHPAGAAVQQHLGEPPGRRAEVRAGAAGGVERQGVERGEQLAGAATDPHVLRRPQRHPPIDVHLRRRVGHHQPADQHVALLHELPRPVARRRQPPLHQPPIHPDLLAHSPTVPVRACSTRGCHPAGAGAPPSRSGPPPTGSRTACTTRPACRWPPWC